MILTVNSKCAPPTSRGAWGVRICVRGDFMLTYFFDTVGYLSGSGLLSDFFALASVAICIAICRKVFTKGV